MIFTIGIAMYGAAKLHERMTGSYLSRSDWKATAGMFVGVAGLVLVGVSLGIVAARVLP